MPDREAAPSSAFELAAGATLPATEITLDRVGVTMGAATTNTFFEGHIDPDYAIRQGRRDVYLATGAVAGLIDSYVLGWFGPRAFLRSRSVRMKDSLCAGDVAQLRGTVVAVEDAAEGRTRADGPGVSVASFDVTIVNQLRLCVQARVVVEVPSVPSGDS